MQSSRIATTDYQNKNGVLRTTTEWHGVVVRNRLAEICEKYLKKGDKVYLEGRLKTWRWESEGQVHYTAEVHASLVKFMSNQRPPQNSPGESLYDDTGNDAPQPPEET